MCMYRIKPLILPLTSLLMPNSMYEMNLLVNSSGAYIGIYPPSEDGEFNDRVVMTNNFEANYSELNAILTRQEQLMSVLDHIERNLHTLEEMLGELGDNGVEAPALPLLSLPLPSELSRIEANIQELEDVQNSEEGAVGGEDIGIRDIVISTHPCHAPYALICMNMLHKDSFYLDIELAALSPIDVIPHMTQYHFQCITAFDDYLKTAKAKFIPLPNVQRINVLVIWKLSDKFSMTVAEGGVNVVINDEVNSLRYINDLVPMAALKYDCFSTQMETNQIDKLVDVCFDLRRTSFENEDTKIHLRILTVFLRKKSTMYFGGNIISLLDICIFSVLNQCPQPIKYRNFPCTLIDWHKRVQNYLGLTF